MFENPVIIAGLITILAAAATIVGVIPIFTKQTNTRLLAFGLSFSGGAMIYISLVEIFVKSQLSFGEITTPKFAYSYATIAFFIGICLMVILDKAIPHPHTDIAGVHDHHHGTRRQSLKKLGLLTALAISIHNIPEGMATFFATLDSPTIGIGLAFAIAIHNIPEGISVAVPIFYATRSKKKAIWATVISAIAEPIGAFAGYFVLSPFIGPHVFGAVFGAIAGAMVYLSLDELIPTAKRYAQGHETIYGIVSGMGIIALSLALFK